MSRGLFIAFEGIDASGKSTQARRVAQERDALFTFEPGDTPLGVELRKWLLDASVPMSFETEALLMLADRSHHAQTIIVPALASGRHVVTDRYLGSTIAYQGYGRGVDVSKLLVATDLAVTNVRPDLTILIDIDVEVANERRARNDKDRFESADAAFHERVREGFLAQAAQNADSWFVVDGSNDLATVASIIDERLNTLLWS